ncbi:DUF6531 domain-containing protein [Streptomyces sp. NPDC096205]|uniref:DUF6531 domain-containing protein n=1 Tax=Streptomyces sp. NPDC096205 TaxID=3366081 RepID=UPI0038085FE3
MVDLNPLHYVNKFNHMFGDTLASGLEFLGITDPAVDPDGVREIAKKWRHLATGLDGAAEAARKALAEVEWEGEAAKAFHKRSKAARKQATDMADALREGAKALDDFADQAHELLTEMGVLVAEIAEFEIAGLALSVLTGGASAVVSSLMAGSRAVKVVALVARIEKEGTVLASAIRGVMEVIRAVERALKALKEIRGVATAAKYAKEGAKFSAFDALLRDPAAFKDPDKLAGILTEGALLGLGFGVLGKALGKGLKALKPADLAKLSRGLKLNCATFERLKLNPGFNKLPASVRNMVKKFVRDPIDVATGEMVLPRVDVRLPGVLPLILERIHISSYRFGGWFGPSWASTLDQRVQAEDEGFVYAAADGARLCFPMPDPESNIPVPAETPGSRVTLSWDDETDGAVRITDLETGLISVFHSPVAAADDTVVDLPLHHVQDRNGNRITVAYSEGDVPAAVVHSGGYHIALDRHPTLSRITGLRLIDPEAPHKPGTPLLTFVYDELGHLVEELNSSGAPMRYTYDSEGRVTSWTDRNHTTYWYTYDEHGRVIATGGTGNALASTLAYDGATRTTRVTDSLGHTRVYEHNESLRLIRETDPLGNVTTQVWDSRLQLTAVTDALGHTTRYGYDEHGRVLSVVRPDGGETSVVYDGHGLPASVRDPDGTEQRYEHDARGNRVAVIDAAGATTRFGFDSRGRLTSITDAEGQTTVLRCDAVGLPVVIKDALHAVTRYERNAFGRPTTIMDAAGRLTRLEWTVEGRLARRTEADGSAQSWTYDGEGNCTSHTDPTGAVTRFEYTHFDLMSARTEPDGTRHTFVHDTELRLVQVVNPTGLTWRYAYDAAGRLESETDFEGRRLLYTRDAAGRVSSRVNAINERVSFERNAVGQVIRKVTDSETTFFGYTMSGQLAEARNNHVVLTLVHDAQGNVTSESINGRTTSYGHDRVGRRTQRVTPTGAVSAWSYDAVGNPARLTACGRAIDFEHDSTGRELARRIGETLTLSHTYDSVGRVSTQSLNHVDGRGIQHRSFAYRADGHLLQIDDQLRGSRSLRLDSVGRVTGVDAEGWTERYSYDPAGIQTSAHWPTFHPGQEATGERVSTGARVLRAGRVRYEYDAQGRMTLRQRIRLSRKPDTWRYTWDAEDRLTSVITPDGVRWRYLYDPLGRRVAKRRFAPDDETVLEQVDFVWDGSRLCEQTTTSADLPHPVSLTWEHQGQQPILQAERMVSACAPQEEIDARFFAMVTDLIGTPTELVDAAGDVAWHARTTLWGVTAWNTGASAYTPLRFPGQYFDPETGLHYNYFRHYDPETAQYLTKDPLGLAPAPLPTAYVDNPHTWSDPLGLAPECEHAAVTETRNRIGDGSIVSQHPMNADEALDAAEKFLGDGYRELGKGRGVFRSADGLRQFRMDPDSMRGGHWPDIPHVHFEIFTPGGKKAVVNNHVPLIE